MKKWMPLLCLALCVLLALPAYAERVDPDHAASLTLRLTESGVGLSGATFEVFRVAEMDDDARLAMLDSYQAGSVDINRVEGAEAWAALAERLAKQVRGSGLVAKTNQQGRAVLSDLPSGLYLVLGQRTEIGHWIYDFAPFLVSVPGKNGDHWQYDAVADVKYQRSPQIFDMKVIKYWQDAGYVDQRPKAIKVDLYCNGAVERTVELNAGNRWSYTFTGLETRHTWMVREQTVPSGYRVAYGEQSGAQTITNTYVVKEPGQQVIPQTGLLWWPVPVMAVLGLAMLMIGLAMRRKWSNEP
ncbi:MAG: Cna B-type domain-containing protein [Clostridia bacterium]|nr:Cna B-type domain-containing protein [Clostridia bacterium]MBP3651298.1 Cna B-type domain-containing protein [Clostridia bacterium]